MMPSHAKVPAGVLKKELLDYVDQIPTYVQQLQFAVKNPTVGKAATFTKVDNVIQETKNCMNVVSKVVTTCFECANKVTLDSFNRSGQKLALAYICLSLVYSPALYFTESSVSILQVPFGSPLQFPFVSTFRLFDGRFIHFFHWDFIELDVVLVHTRIDSLFQC